MGSPKPGPRGIGIYAAGGKLARGGGGKGRAGSATSRLKSSRGGGGKGQADSASSPLKSGGYGGSKGRADSASSPLKSGGRGGSKGQADSSATSPLCCWWWAAGLERVRLGAARRGPLARPPVQRDSRAESADQDPERAAQAAALDKSVAEVQNMPKAVVQEQVVVDAQTRKASADAEKIKSEEEAGAAASTVDDVKTKQTKATAQINEAKDAGDEAALSVAQAAKADAEKAADQTAVAAAVAVWRP